MVPPYTRHFGAKNGIPSHFWISIVIIALSCCSSVPKNQVLGSPDEVLRVAVEAALAADSRLDAAAIVITVATGVVELSGTVGSADQARRAIRRAGQVDGVRGIVNRLRVLGQ